MLCGIGYFLWVWKKATKKKEVAAEGSNIDTINPFNSKLTF